MTRGAKPEICLAFALLLSASAVAVTPAGTDSPYNAIVERNVFNLHAPPPPVNPADLVKKTPPPKVTLTGITTILGQKKTFLTIPPVKPGAPPDSMMLAEGQALNEIEVKRIDEKAGVVDIVNHGESQTLDFDHDGAKPAGAPPGGPGGPQSFAMPTPTAAQPQVTPMPSPGTAIRPLRSLAPRTDFNNNNNNSFGNGFGGAAGAQNGTIQQQQNQLTPEEQVALIEIQRVKMRQEKNRMSELLPNTELTPEVTGQQAPQ
jgi:hypothetical protein